ncbi:MAG: dTDP-4-dehydrorhamnose 3,5-epimerase family protein, partial [Nitrosopumilaceae archaeon]
MLPGIKIKELTKFPDERGYFSEIFREDWLEFVESDKTVQTNFTFSYPGMIRAWHRHHRGQVDYFVVVKGSIKVCAYDDRPDSKTKGQLD